MTHCLFCHDPVDARGLRMTWSITTSIGRVLSVDVVACVDCAHARRTTLGEVFDLARRRHDRDSQWSEVNHAATK